jgi:hypothetical protein
MGGDRVLEQETIVVSDAQVKVARLSGLGKGRVDP